jgi:hypothetical protein
MSQATFAALIDFNIGDMLRRNCTPDSITTNRRTTWQLSIDLVYSTASSYYLMLQNFVKIPH